MNSIATAGTFNVCQVNSMWSESTIAYDSSPELGTYIASNVPIEAADQDQYILVDITPTVVEWLNGSRANDGIALVANGILDASFDSKENTTTSHAPELDVVFAGDYEISQAKTGGISLAATTTASGTITGVTAGTDLTGGGTSGNVTLNVDTAKVPQLNSANAFVGNQTVTGSIVATGGGLTGALVANDPANQDLEVQAGGDINHTNLQGEGPSFVCINDGSQASKTCSFVGRSGDYPGSTVNGIIHFGWWDGVNTWHPYLDFFAGGGKPSRLRIGDTGAVLVNPSGAVNSETLDPEVAVTNNIAFMVMRRNEDNNTQELFRAGSDYAAFPQNIPLRVGGLMAINHNQTPIAAADIFFADNTNAIVARRSSTGQTTFNVFSDTSGNAEVQINNASGTPQITADASTGNLHVSGGLSVSGAKHFKIDHPLDPANKYLYHTSVESPDMMNVYNGNVILDAAGEAEIQLPDYFEALNQNFRYQLTCIGGFAPVYVSKEIDNNRFHIAGGTSGLKVSWQVTGIRHDAYAEAHRGPVEVEKPAGERGHYLHPELFGASPEQAIGYRTAEPVNQTRAQGAQ